MNLYRRLAAVALASVLGVMFVPTAHAITNPADNPYRIVVKGDDGNTYVDGQDTLPGYDDEECTYIPGAWFDFAKNRVHYADGQSIPWTEWERASGYKDWVAKQATVKKPAATATPTAKATTKATATATSTAATTAAAVVKTTTSTAPATAAKPAAAATKSAATSTVAAVVATAAATPTAVASSVEPTAAAEQTPEVVAVSAAGIAPARTGENPGRATGLAILGALLVLGAATYAGSGVRRRIVGRERA